MTFGSLAIVLFWLSFATLFWVYFGYYLCLRLIGLFFEREIAKRESSPDVSIIIAAYNEEARIAQKLVNTLALNYRKDKIETIVVCDGCTDSTHDLVTSFANRGIKLLSFPQRRGKHHCQLLGIELARGDIVVFTDVATHLQSNAVVNIVRAFADPSVGCVSGVDRIRQEQSESAGEDSYVGYEMKLRAAESKVGSLVGASGSFFAVRRCICGEWEPDLSSDFVLPIIAHIKGMRTVSDPEAIGYYSVVGKAEQEFRRKIRTIVHGLEALFHFAKILNPFKYGSFSLQIISHKLLRWLSPFCLVLLLLSSLFLNSLSPVYRLAAIAQLIMYCLAATAYFLRSASRLLAFRISLFFVMTNLAIAIAWIKFLRRERYILWESTRR